ncbi:MAG: PilZ domain-containing protein [Thermodesulfobacteriota bacterium]
MTTEEQEEYAAAVEADMRERRRDTRYRVTPQGVVVLTPDPVISFDVFDVSRGGLSFTYAGWRQWAEDSLRMDFLGRRIVLEKVPVEVVSDVAFSPADPAGDGFPLRRCSVRFGQLDTKQEQRLVTYLSQLSTKD